jgi:hypothetical protein
MLTSKLSRTLPALFAIVRLFVIVVASATLNHSGFPRSQQKEARVTKNASGSFEVKLGPQSDENVGDPTVGRMSIDKQFHGDLEGTSKGQMLMVGTSTEGSAGYVALERVNGKLDGRTGSFALQHTGTMDRGAAQLSVTVVPDSGTDGLKGLSGKMTIKIIDGKHLYEFEYSLAQAP